MRVCVPNGTEGNHKFAYGVCVPTETEGDHKFACGSLYLLGLKATIILPVGLCTY